MTESTITPDKLKILKTEVMENIDYGGGLPTNEEVIDGKSNEIFDDVTDIDALLGKVKLAKVGFAVKTDNTEALQSGRIIFTKLPENKNLSVFCMKATAFNDRRSDAQNKLESYLAPGPKFPGHILEKQLAGQSIIQQSLGLNDPLPVVGQSLLLIQNEGLNNEFYQYVRVEKVESRKRTFQINLEKSIERVVADIYLSDSLRYTFNGPNVGTFSTSPEMAILREARIADAARYYSASKLVRPIEKMTTRQIKIDSIFTQVVPSTQVETPIIQNDLGNQQRIPIKSSEGSILVNQSDNVAPNKSLLLPGGVYPGSLTLNLNNLTLTDINNEVLDEIGVAYGAINHETGNITWYDNANWGQTDIEGSYKPSVSLVRVTYTDYQIVGENGGYTYIRELGATPTAGTLKVSYQVNNNTYIVFDNGKGNLIDAEGNGRGTIRDRSVILTTEAIPDSGSPIIYTFSTDLNTKVYQPQSLEGAYHLIPMPENLYGDVELTWGTNKTATLSNSVITGDAKGELVGNDLHFIPNTLLNLDDTINISYQLLSGNSSKTGSDSFEKLPNGNIKALIDFDGPIIKSYNTINISGPYFNELKYKIVIKTNEAGEAEVYLLDHYIPAIFSRPAMAGSAGSGGSSGSASSSVIHRIYSGPSYSSEPSSTRKSKAFDLEIISQSVNNQTGQIAIEIMPIKTAKHLDVISRPGVSPIFKTKEVGKRVDIKNIFGINSKATIQEVTETKTKQIELGALLIDLPKNDDTPVVNGSVMLDIFDMKNIKDSNNEIIYNKIDVIGEINYDKSMIVLDSWTPNKENIVYLKAMIKESEPTPLQSIIFKTNIAPVKKASLQISCDLITKDYNYENQTNSDGSPVTVLVTTEIDLGSVSISTDNQGNFTGTQYAHGKFDFKIGFGNLYFYKKLRVLELTDEYKATAPWYDIEDEYKEELADGTTVDYINKPVYIKPDSFRYNALGFKYMPLDSEIIGLDPVRLPSDGRVQFVRKGDTIAITELKTKDIQTLSAGDLIDTEFTRLSDLAVFDADNVKIDFDFLNIDLDSGIFIIDNTFDSSIYNAPYRVDFRIMDLGLVLETDISGLVTLSQTVTHNYTENAVVSSMLLTNDLQARITNVFSQKVWTEIFDDNLIGDRSESQLQVVNYPIEITNADSIKERWALVFTGSTSFKIIGEISGEIGMGSTQNDTSPINPMTGRPYWTIRKEAWGIGQDTGNVVRFNQHAAIYVAWLGVSIQQHQATAKEDYSFIFDFHGNVNRDRQIGA